MAAPLNVNPRHLSTDYSLSTMVPAFNEVNNLTPTVNRLMRALMLSVEDFEIIVVDDGSVDGTAEVADGLGRDLEQVRVIHNPKNMGLGYCYLRGLEEARTSYFAYIPGDNSWPYRSFLELFGQLGKADVITSYSTNPQARPPGRRLASAAYTRMLNALFGHRMRYYNGLTIYPIDFLRRNPPSTFGFGFQAEVLLKALEEGLSVVETALPIDETMASGSKAITRNNLLSVAATVMRTYGALRLHPPRSKLGQSERSRIFAREPSRTSSTRPDAKVSSKSLRVLIAGASSGLGKALLQALAEDGHEVFACARRADLLLDATCQGTVARGKPCDVTDEKQVIDLAGWLGDITPQLDVLVNCFGGFGAIGPIDKTDTNQWVATLQVNVVGAYLMIKHLLPLLASSEGGRIINFSGGGAFGPFPNYSAYACSKSAVVRLTECLAAELAPRGITINAVAPGFVSTPAHQATLDAGPELAGTLHFRRTQAILNNGGGDVQTVVDCVKMLLSDESRGLTGKTLSANFDPWETAAFKDRMRDISRSDLWTMRRVNIVNLPVGSLKTQLEQAWASHAAES